MIFSYIDANIMYKEQGVPIKQEDNCIYPLQKKKM